MISATQNKENKMTKVTYTECVKDYDLWMAHISPEGHVTRSEFEKMALVDKIQVCILVDYFRKEAAVQR